MLNVLAPRDVTLARQLFDERCAWPNAWRPRSITSGCAAGQPQSFGTSSIHLDVLRDLTCIHGHIIPIGYPILEAADELSETRLRKAQEQLLMSARASRCRASRPDPARFGLAAPALDSLRD
ncbi:hypothetical protein ACFPOB_09800 [Bosea eneae]|uniref:Uncharacterized protein n=1 Tax=Bosea eneae TaxID=151454 RepID=A0ABW0IRU9_9HYPH